MHLTLAFEHAFRLGTKPVSVEGVFEKLVGNYREQEFMIASMEPRLQAQWHLI